MKGGAFGISLALLLLAFAAHGRALGAGFVYDDHRFIEHNVAIASLRDPVSFFVDPSTASAAQGVQADIYRPLRTLHFAVDRALFGLRPFGWHLASVLLHGLNGVLVFLLLLRLLVRAPSAGSGDGSPPHGRGDASGAAVLAAAIGAALFVTHPVTVESTAWISSRGDLLAWTFALLAFEAFAKEGRRRTLLGVVFVALACLAKESALALVALVPLRDLAAPEGARPSRRTTVARTALVALVAGTYLGVRALVLPAVPDVPWMAQTGFPDDSRAAAARGMLASLVWYARVLVWPSGFPFDRNVFTDPVPTSWGDPEVVLGLGLLLSTVLAGIVALRARRGAIAFACLGALAALGPVSNVLVPLKAFSAERFLYPALPCLAAGFAALGLSAARRLSPGGRRILVGAGCVAVAACVALSWGRTASWHDERTLWEAVRRESPNNPRAYEGLGLELLKEGHIDGAERALGTYREFQPLDGKVHAELAATFRRLHDDLAGSASRELYETSNLRERLARVLRQSMLESRAAFDAWSRVGLARGRGDLALLRSTLVGWREAALELGDLREASRTNEMLSMHDGRDGASAAYEQRRMRLVIAGLALSQREEGRRRDAARDLDRARVRAESLRAAGIDPNLSDPDALAALRPLLGAMLEERPTDHALRRQRVLGMFRVAQARGREPDVADLAQLEADLVALVAAYPGDEGLRRNLDGVRARRSR